MRAARRSSAASIRRLNLSCMARSLLRRSAERHRITVSSVSGWRASLTSTPVVDRAPAVRRGELGGELLQLRLGRADDVAPAGLAQPGQVPGAGHAAIGDPDPADHAMPGLHGGHDRLQGAAPCLATAPAPDIRRQTGASVRYGRPSDEPAPSDARCRPQTACLLRAPDQMTRKRTRLDATARVKLAEMCNCLLDHTPAHPHAAHQPPITVDLPVLLHRRVAQIHAPSKLNPERNLVGTTRPNPIFPTANPLIRLRPPRQINSPIPAQTAQVGLIAWLIP